MKQEWIWMEALPLVLGVGLVGCFMAAIVLLPYEQANGLIDRLNMASGCRTFELYRCAALRSYP